MDIDTVVIMFKAEKKKIAVDLEVPLHISANELVFALNAAYDLEIDTENIKNCFLKAENPISLLRGNKTLEEFGIRNGSIVYYSE